MKKNNNVFFHSIVKKKNLWAIEVSYKSGVTDAVGDSVRKGINDLGIKKILKVSTVQKYIIEGILTEKEIERICKDLLANSVIQTYKFRKI